MFKRTLVILSSRALLGTTLTTPFFFLFKVAGYKKPLFNSLCTKPCLKQVLNRWC